MSLPQIDAVMFVVAKIVHGFWGFTHFLSHVSIFFCNIGSSHPGLVFLWVVSPPDFACLVEVIYGLVPEGT